MAQARFRYWDGRSWTHQTTNAKDPSAGTPVLGPGFARLSDWLGRCLALVAVACLAMCVVLLWAASTFSGYLVGPVSGAFQPGSHGVASAQPPGSDGPVLGLLVGLGLYALTSLVTGVVWCVWQHQLAAAAPGELRRGPAMHVVSWFIPVVGYWWPFQNMVDLWNAYGIGRDPSDRQVASGLGVWWATYLGLPVVVSFLGGVWMGAGLGQDLITRVAVVYGAVFCSLLVAAMVARGVVRRLSWRALEFHTAR